MCCLPCPCLSSYAVRCYAPLTLSLPIFMCGTILWLAQSLSTCSRLITSLCCPVTVWRRIFISPIPRSFHCCSHMRYSLHLSVYTTSSFSSPVLTCVGVRQHAIKVQQHAIKVQQHTLRTQKHTIRTQKHAVRVQQHTIRVQHAIRAQQHANSVQQATTHNHSTIFGVQQCEITLQIINACR